MQLIPRCAYWDLEISEEQLCQSRSALPGESQYKKLCGACRDPGEELLQNRLPDDPANFIYNRNTEAYVEEQDEHFHQDILYIECHHQGSYYKKNDGRLAVGGGNDS